MFWHEICWKLETWLCLVMDWLLVRELCKLHHDNASSQIFSESAKKIRKTNRNARLSANDWSKASSSILFMWGRGNCKFCHLVINWLPVRNECKQSESQNLMKLKLLQRLSAIDWSKASSSRQEIVYWHRNCRSHSKGDFCCTEQHFGGTKHY
jgi:hypothetical protein